MNRSVRHSILALTILAFLSVAQGAPLEVPWVNGDFVAGGAGWSTASGNSYEDADADGDSEVVLRGCGDGSFQLSRGLSILPMPGTADIAFEVDVGQIDFWDIRVILVDHDDPTPYLNNYALAPNWLDDDVLIWSSWSSPLAGSVRLDPAAAASANIDGWASMSAEEREAYLGGVSYTTLVMYACVAEPAAVDDFRWIL